MKENLNLGERETWLKYNIKGKKKDVIHCKVCFAAEDEPGIYSIPQIKFKEYNIKIIHLDANFCKVSV